MNPSIPTFLFPYMLYGTLATIATLLFGIHHSLKAAGWRVQDRTRALLSSGALLAVFYTASLIAARLGLFQGTASHIPTIQYGILTPIVLGILLFMRWPSFRRIVEAVPQSWLVGVQFYRTLGVIFLILYAVDRLPAQFALPAGAGDVLIGLFAPLAAIAYARKWPHTNAFLRAWNLLGIADLVVAITTGFLTTQSPFQLLAFDAPNQLIGQYPLVMVPVFLVPIAILLHLASLQRLRHPESVQQIRVLSSLSERG